MGPGVGRLLIKSLSSVFSEEQQLVLHNQSTDCGSKNPSQLGLTPRETEVLFWMSRGKRNSEIGTILGVNQRTVTKHLERVFQKLNVDTRTAAAAIALDCLRKGTPGI